MDDSRQRDAVSLRMMGIFFVLLGSLVGIGALWIENNTRGLVVDIASAMILVGIGWGMLRIGSRLAR